MDKQVHIHTDGNAHTWIWTQDVHTDGCVHIGRYVHTGVHICIFRWVWTCNVHTWMWKNTCKHLGMGVCIYR